MGDDFIDHTDVSYEEAVRSYEAGGDKRILLIGPRKSGKSSIERVIFHKMSPHETLFLGETHNVEIQRIANNDFVQFQTWDFGGELSLQSGVFFKGKKISSEVILRGCSTIVYVIDAQEGDFDDCLPKLVTTILAAYKVNPAINFEVFLHKVDVEMMPEEMKLERLQGIQNYVTGELRDNETEILVSYYLTSIHDHSALEAFSKVVQKLVRHMPVLNNLLDKLIESCAIDKSYLLDVFTKLYIATDSNPVDSHTYELCSDLVDVVIDVSCIYGLSVEEGTTIPYDYDSSSAVRLNSGLVLYLREVSKYLALVCVIREEHFAKRSLLDFNIDCFRRSLDLVTGSDPGGSADGSSNGSSDDHGIN
eukprot:gene26714-35393_t